MPFVYGLILDPVTLLFCISLLSLLMASMTWAASVSIGAQRNSLLIWSSAMAMAGLSFMCFLFRGKAPWFISFALANALLIGSAALIMVAHAKLLRVRKVGRYAVAMVCLGLTGVVTNYVLGTDVRVTSLTMSIASALGLAAVSVLHVLDPSKQRLALSRTTAAAFFCTASVYAVRALRSLGSDVQSVSLVSPSGVHMVALATGGAFIAVASICFLYQTLQLRQRDVEEAAKRDALTGVFNRGALFEEAKQLDSNETAKNYAVVMFDVDHFKAINDTYGHSGGDVVLAYVGRLMREHARITDFVARFGGEEFCVILQDAGTKEASGFAERVIEAARSSSVRLDSGKTVKFTISAGYATASARRGRKEFSRVIEAADQALYNAKRGGRDKVIGMNSAWSELAESPAASG